MDRLCLPALSRCASENENMFTGDVEVAFDGVELPLSEKRTTIPDHVIFYGVGDRVYLVWNDGEVHRFDTRNFKSNVPTPIVEDLLNNSSLNITSIRLALGNTTLLVGDSAGNLTGWLQTRSKDGQPGDYLRKVHKLPQGPGSVTSIGLSSRSRMISIGYEDGTVKIFHVTTD